MTVKRQSLYELCFALSQDESAEVRLQDQVGDVLVDQLLVHHYFLHVGKRSAEPREEGSRIKQGSRDIKKRERSTDQETKRSRERERGEEREREMKREGPGRQDLAH